MRVSELLDCKDPSLDAQTPLTTLDVAFMNHDLTDALIEIMEDNLQTRSQPKELEMIEIKPTEVKKEKGKISLNKDFYIEASELSYAEQLAHEVSSMDL